MIPDFIERVRRNEPALKHIAVDHSVYVDLEILKEFAFAMRHNTYLVSIEISRDLNNEEDIPPEIDYYRNLIESYVRNNRSILYRLNTIFRSIFVMLFIGDLIREMWHECYPCSKSELLWFTLISVALAMVAFSIFIGLLLFSLVNSPIKVFLEKVSDYRAIDEALLPKSSNFHLSLIIYENLKTLYPDRTDLIEKLEKKLLHISQNFNSAFYFLGEIYLRENKRKEACEMFLRVDPQQVNATYYIKATYEAGNYLLVCDDYSEAIALFKKGLGMATREKDQEMVESFEVLIKILTLPSNANVLDIKIDSDEKKPGEWRKNQPARINYANLWENNIRNREKNGIERSSEYSFNANGLFQGHFLKPI